MKQEKINNLFLKVFFDRFPAYSFEER